MLKCCKTLPAKCAISAFFPSVSRASQTAKACTSRGAHAVHIAPADCCTMAQIDLLTKTVLDQYGPIDILVWT